jgi:hypothetical protein
LQMMAAAGKIRDKSACSIDSFVGNVGGGPVNRRQYVSDSIPTASSIHHYYTSLILQVSQKHV